MLPLLGAMRAAVDCHVAALPVPYRTTEAEPSFQSLTDAGLRLQLPGGRPFPTALEPLHAATATRSPSSPATPTTLGVRYLGVCCGNAPHHHPQHGRGARPHARRRAATAPT